MASNSKYIRRRMEERLMEERKHMLLDLMKDPTYVPMKMKELAMLFRRPERAAPRTGRSFK